MATKNADQLKAAVKGARFGRHEEKALLDLIDNSASGGVPAASPATAAGTDAAIINNIVAQLESYGIYTG